MSKLDEKELERIKHQAKLVWIPVLIFLTVFLIYLAFFAENK